LRYFAVTPRDPSTPLRYAQDDGVITRRLVWFSNSS
jgi:hypothetical protein